MAPDHSELDPQQTAHPVPVELTPVPVVQSQGHAPVPATITSRAFPPRRRRLPIVTGMLGLIVLLGLAFWYWSSNDPVAGHYKTLRIERGPITALVTATGAVNPVISVQVGSQVSGKIAKLYADFNSVVREGQILASIDQKPYQAAVASAA